MRKIFTLTASFIVAVFILASCGGANNEQKGSSNDSTKIEQAIPADIQAMMPRGEEIYKTKCVACHQNAGQGVANVFPPLAQSDYLLADKVRAVAQTLNGSKLDMMVNGAKYTQAMPAQVQTKEDAVAVINYVLNNFGNKGGYVTLDEVKDLQINPIKL